MDGILKEFEKLSKLRSFDKFSDDIDHILEHLQATKSLITEDPSNSAKYLADLQEKLTKLSKQITEAEKELYSGISKYGKALDKTFKLNVSAGYNPRVFQLQTGAVLNKAILMHLARSGHFDVASKFMEEAHVDVPEGLLSEFSHMYGILQSLQANDLKPAIDWASSKRKELLARGSNLEFSLHKLQFVRYLLSDDINIRRQALAYARQNLSIFGDRYLRDIARLMSSILYLNTPSISPYAEIYQEPSFEQLSWKFSSEFCSLLGLNPESPLYLAVTAGSMALPVLAKIDSLMKSKKTEWTTYNELPVAIDLPESFRFHSIFVCPVSKEQTTETNPPMMLPCGHILANDSLKLLSKENPNHTFKCPYCPSDTTYALAKQVYF